MRPCAIRERLADAGGHAADDADRGLRRSHIEAKQAARHIGRADRAENAGRMQAMLVEFLRRDQTEPADEFAARDDRGEKLGSTRAGHLGDRECTARNRGGDVDDGFLMRIVENEAGRQRTVRQCRSARARRVAKADDVTRAPGPDGERGCAHRFARSARPGGEREADIIEDAQLGRIHEVLRNIAKREIARPRPGQRAG